MACFAHSNCLFGGIGTFTTCGSAMDRCGMNNNCGCNQNCNCGNRCMQQLRRERTCDCDDARSCDNDRDRSGCDRCD